MMSIKRQVPKVLDEAAMRVIGRVHARYIVGKHVLGDWQPVLPASMPDGTFQIWRGTELVVEIEGSVLRKSTLIETLIELLSEQAFAARYAVQVASIELGTHAKRKTPRKPDPAARRQRADERALWLTKAQECRTKNPHLSNSEIARRLNDRHGFPREAVRKALAKPKSR